MNWRRCDWKLAILACALLSVSLARQCAWADEIRTDYAMFHDPEFSDPGEVKQMNPELLSLWDQALARPEVEYQRLTAEAIATAAEAGYPGMEPARDDLLRILSAEESHPSARHAAARALIALDTRTASDALFEASQIYGSQLRMLVEPALADWEFEPIREVWRDRVRDPQTNRTELILALEGLAHVHDADVLPEMLAIVHSADRAADIRIVAARAAGAATDTGLEPEVHRLLSIESAGVLHRLCAVALLSRHSSQECRQLLADFSGDAEPTVAEQSLGRLFAIDPALVVPLAETAMQNADPKVRQWGVDAYVVLPTPDRIVVLSRMLNDVHPTVRGSVREAFFALAAQPEFNDVVRDSTVEILAQDNWRGQEQAALLVGALDHEPAAGRLLELLQAERQEVMVTAAWALRVLELPELLPQMFAHAERQSQIRATIPVNGLDQQVAHLFEAFGVMKYMPADELMRGYVPKIMSNGYYSRGAAIWALGHLHAGQTDDALAAQLAERMNDTGSIPGEHMIVFRMSATSLGRMQGDSQLPALRYRLELTNPYDPVANAVRWTLHELTGEEFPELEPVIRQRAGWFLEPVVPEEPPAPASDEPAS